MLQRQIDANNLYELVVKRRNERADKADNTDPISSIQDITNNLMQVQQQDLTEQQKKIWEQFAN